METTSFLSVKDYRRMTIPPAPSTGFAVKRARMRQNAPMLLSVDKSIPETISTRFRAILSDYELTDLTDP